MLSCFSTTYMRLISWWYLVIRPTLSSVRYCFDTTMAETGKVERVFSISSCSVTGCPQNLNMDCMRRASELYSATDLKSAKRRLFHLTFKSGRRESWTLPKRSSSATHSSLAFLIDIYSNLSALSIWRRIKITAWACFVGVRTNTLSGLGAWIMGNIPFEVRWFSTSVTQLW